jgi:hypothetical protein
MSRILEIPCQELAWLSVGKGIGCCSHRRQVRAAWGYRCRLLSRFLILEFVRITVLEFVRITALGCALSEANPPIRHLEQQRLVGRISRLVRDPNAFRGMAAVARGRSQRDTPNLFEVANAQ